MSHPRFRLFVSLLAALSGAAGCGTSSWLQQDAQDSGVHARARGERWIVALEHGQRPPAILRDAAVRVVDTLPALDVVVVAGVDRNRVLGWARRPGIRWVEEDGPMSAAGHRVFKGLAWLGGDELLPKLWGMQAIGASKVWSSQPGRPEVKVAVIDTGVDALHPDLAGRVEKGRDFINQDEDPDDDDGHGTHCAGVVAAGIGNGGVVGVAPGVTVLAVKVLDGKGGGTFVSVAAGIVHAADRGAKVLSLSLSGSRTSRLLEEAVAHAGARGALVVAASGNAGSTAPAYPAALPGVMAVGAVRRGDMPAYFSNTGRHLSVTAPGVDILSTVPGGSWESLDGTSMACPHVAGEAALLFSRHASWTAAQVRRRIEQTAVDIGDEGWDVRHGHGRIDVARALR